MSKRITLLVAAAAVSLTGSAFAKEPAKMGPPAKAPAAAAEKLKVTLPTSLEWHPLIPNMATGPQVATVHGDMKKGPVSFFIKIPKGYKSGMHIHTADYQAIVIQGTPTHIAEGETATPLAAGTWFFQPGKGVHEDGCVGDTDCINYVQLADTMDFTPVGPQAATAPAKGAEKAPAVMPAKGTADKK